MVHFSKKKIYSPEDLVFFKKKAHMVLLLISLQNKLKILELLVYLRNISSIRRSIKMALICCLDLWLGCKFCIVSIDMISFILLLTLDKYRLHPLIHIGVRFF